MCCLVVVHRTAVALLKRCCLSPLRFTGGEPPDAGGVPAASAAH